MVCSKCRGSPSHADKAAGFIYDSCLITSTRTRLCAGRIDSVVSSFLVLPDYVTSCTECIINGRMTVARCLPVANSTTVQCIEGAAIE